MNFTRILYSPWGGHELFENNIKKPLREYLEREPCLIAEDGSQIRPNEAIRIEDVNIKELLTKSDLETLYPGKKILHSDCLLPWEIEELIEKEPRFNASSGASHKMQELLNAKAKAGDINFFINFYQRYLIIYKNSSPSTLSKLKSHSIILTENLDLANAYSAYIKPADLVIPQEIKDNFKIVHPEIVSNSDILEMLKILEVKELTSEHIQNVLKAGEIPNISKNWEIFSDTEKIEKVKLCYDLWKKKQIDTKDLSFLKLKTKSGKWLQPKDIVFPKEYKPEHQIESRVERGLFDLPIEFLSTEFIKNETDDEISKWRKFFKELGVDERIEREKDNIVQRIGILTALEYEKIKKRKARELGESEKKGYDIESGSEGEQRYIEVKGSSRSNPDIFITTNEFRTLQEKRDKYFIYVVKDALQNPTLCVTRGSKLLEITDIKTIIPFNKWWESAKEEEFQPWI